MLVWWCFFLRLVRNPQLQTSKILCQIGVIDISELYAVTPKQHIYFQVYDQCLRVHFSPVNYLVHMGRFPQDGNLPWHMSLFWKLLLGHFFQLFLGYFVLWIQCGHLADQISAIENYCTAAYGSNLWNLGEREAAMYTNAWRTGHKLAWDVPRACHSYLVQTVLAPHVGSLRAYFHIFNIFMWARRALPLQPTAAALRRS